MGPPIAAFILTFLVNIAASVCIFVLMLVAMNGYSESDAKYGMGVYGVLALFVTITMSLFAALVAKRFRKREFRAVSAVLIAVVVFSLIGIFLKCICSIIGVGVAEFVRVNF
jgi:uncharacterized membrane protein YhaH (DUF805 family)